MADSMTGFGRGEFQDDEYHITVEIKTVNHRFNEIVIRMPRNWTLLEDRVRKTVLSFITRGRIEIFINIEQFISRNKTVRVDKNLAVAYYKALKELQDELQPGMPVDVDFIAKAPDVLSITEPAADIDVMWAKLEPPLHQALEILKQMRKTEGGLLQQDLQTRLRKIEQLVSSLENRAPAIVEGYKLRLITQIRESFASGEFDETRLMQEVLLFSDRVNVTEELVRLNSHIHQFLLTLNQTGSIGRKLDFIIQEMNRETNTIGSKCNDVEMTNIVVDIKSEIEKIREQVQNLE